MGNQTSQFFANVYLNGLDHFVVREIRPAAYMRYVDDFLLFDPDKRRLRSAISLIEEYLDGLRLLLHDVKSRIYRVQDGVAFLGWRIFPDHSLLQRANVVRFRRKMRRLQIGLKQGRVDWEEIKRSVSAWIGHGMHGDTWRLRRQVFDDFAFQSSEEHPRLESKQE